LNFIANLTIYNVKEDALFKLFLSGKDIKEIILAGKDANCESIVYNGLHVTYKKLSVPSDSLWPSPTPTVFNESDNPNKNEVIGDEAQALSLDLQYKLHEDPIAFEEALSQQGAEWKRKINQQS
jgi:hypothetical protein